MKVIERAMSATAYNTSKDGYSCQASFNSFGQITLRNYNSCEKDKDEIIILSDEETKAIFDLFRRFKQQDMLPF